MSMKDDSREPWLRAVDPDADEPSWVEIYRPWILGAAAFVLLAFGGAIWFAYNSGGRAIGAPPLIQAEEGSVRHKPEDPGGLTVPNRDKLVYNRVNGLPGAEDVHLLPGPELPMDKPVAPEPQSQPETVSGHAPGIVDPLADGAPSAAVVEDSEPVPPAPTEEAPVATPAETVSQAVIVSGDYLLQLGAFSTKEAADTAWEAARKKFPTALGTLKQDIDPLTRDGKTLYRLRGAAFADKATADTACNLLKVGQHPCFVARK